MRNGHPPKVGKYKANTTVVAFRETGEAYFVGKPVGFDQGWYTLTDGAGGFVIEHFRSVRSWDVYQHLCKDGHLQFFEALSQL